mmetsp:Transcript_8305/g.24564  ORF Transcript_8305/g.24564 Transcript_8305/m.24564 type:complete len:168 (-) Transcript_8305:1518-2021(-)
MSSFVSKPADEMNRNMAKFMPELASEYARYPMHHERWYHPSEKGPKGEPCFIKGGDANTLKKDYVFCKYGEFGPGYYSIMTKSAYVNLYNKIDSLQPGTCGIACNSADRKAMDEHDDVKRLMYGRHMASKPCDSKAEKRMMDESEGMAQAAYGLDNPTPIAVSKVRL